MDLGDDWVLRHYKVGKGNATEGKGERKTSGFTGPRGRSAF